MPSFDIVSEVDLQEARNAVDNASREVESRFDFRNVEASFELNDASKTIKVLSESDFQVNQLLDILRAKLLKRGIEGSSLDVPENIVHSGKTWFVEAKPVSYTHLDVYKRQPLEGSNLGTAWKVMGSFSAGS